MVVLRKRRNEEAKLTLEIIKYLRMLGYPAGKVKVKGSTSKQGNYILDKFQWKGLPDILAFTPKQLYLEVKMKGNKLSPAQVDFMVFCKAARTPYYVVYSLDDVFQIIKKIELKP